MNLKLIPLALSLALAPAALAEFTVTLTDVHLCCTSCVKGVDKATATAAGAAATCDKDAGTVVLTAPDKATAQKAVDALVAAGYFGKSSDPSIKLDGASGAKDGFVESLSVSGVHLCCKSCVEAVDDALAKVPGVKANTATKNAATFEVTGNFNAKQVFDALHSAGLTGKAK
jgi:copper chaperone CopZ